MTSSFAVNIPSRGLSRTTHDIKAVCVIERIILVEKGRIVMLNEEGQLYVKRTDCVRSGAPRGDARLILAFFAKKIMLIILAVRATTRCRERNNTRLFRGAVFIIEVVNFRLPIAVTARSKASVYGRSLTGIWVRILPRAWMSVCCDCCVLSGRGLCDGLITRPEESYRVWCVCV
jgi:hypothetical protein